MITMFFAESGKEGCCLFGETREVCTQKLRKRYHLEVKDLELCFFVEDQEEVSK